LRRETVEIDALFASVLSRFEWRAEQLGKRVGSRPTAGLRVDADRLRLEQALSNLVDNALRHGGDQITLEAAQQDGAVELHVRDNGGGFPHGFAPRAFDRFARADAARASGGAGLGLAIVKTIAESHDGSAHVASAQPGADAWLSLPAD
jgi:two-component system OmpR family sensor kinase